jgi:hypothetical protein
MPKSCIVGRAVASQDILLQYCDACQSALYCSKACQRIDWRQKQHRQICKLLNVGHGDMQVRTDHHTQVSIDLKEMLEEGKGRRKSGRGAKDEEICQTTNQAKPEVHVVLQFRVSCPLRRLGDAFVAKQSTSRDASVRRYQRTTRRRDETRVTRLHDLASMADPFDYSTHENQLILAKQLIDHGANVNAVSIPLGKTPLHDACHGGVVTNLDFVELLLEEGADPNAQDHEGLTPLMCTTKFAPGAAKFLLNWPTTDANITTQAGCRIFFQESCTP